MEAQENFFVTLRRDPPTRLACTFIPPAPAPSRKQTPTLVVFITGISTPSKFFIPVLEHLLSSYSQTQDDPSRPAILTYDRPGVGRTTDRNPSTKIAGRPKGHGRDCLDAAHDLHDVITQVTESRLGIRSASNVDLDAGRDSETRGTQGRGSGREGLKLVFVCASLGCAIGRLYAREWPGTVSAFLFLDSALANSDTISVFPNPSSPDFSPQTLPKGVTADLCLDTRIKIGRIFGTEAPNQEGVWRGNLPAMLPKDDGPVLVGPEGRGPWVTVVVHDSRNFENDFERTLKIPKVMTKTYFDPYWLNFHEGLARLTEKEFSKGPIVAKGCGHLIEKHNPKLVAVEIWELLEKVSEDEKKLRGLRNTKDLLKL